MSYNGGAVIAMSGKDCVAIASDLRFGVRNQTVAFDHPKVYRVADRAFVGLPGLISDAQTLYAITCPPLLSSRPFYTC